MKLDVVINAIKRGEKPTQIDLSDCSLTTIPDELYDLTDCLEQLNLGGNKLSFLPERFKEFEKLSVLFFAGNRFEAIPEVIGRLSSLYMVSFKSNQVREVSETSLSPSIGWLILTDNEIKELPKSIGKLKKLRKCMLAGNQLTSLPEEMKECTNLELLRIASNRLTELPHWLLTLPKLSWLAFAGNFIPMTQYPAPAVTPTIIPWNQIELQDVLGEGASGIVYRAKLLGEGEVAVKLFKGEATSDGLPEDEMKAYEAVGKHPGCVELRGRVSDALVLNAPDYPRVVPALVFRLLPESYTPLAGPPSFDSVTRDVYPQTKSTELGAAGAKQEGDGRGARGNNFSLLFVLKVLSCVASVCSHMHTRGISHGDLYGHNILVDFALQRALHDSKNSSATVLGSDTDLLNLPLLGDFGAASFYDRDDSTMATLVEGLEVRAFGCLLEELVDRIVGTEIEKESAKAGDVILLSSAATELKNLLEECLGGDPKCRPRFSQIVERLAAIENSRVSNL